MEPVPDPDVTNPPGIEYERVWLDVLEPTEGSLNRWARWCQESLKYISDKVQDLDTRFANWGQIKADQIADMNIKLMQQEQRIEALEKKLEEPVADRTRYRKQSRRPSPGPR